jgi:hypothetical protein
MRRADKRGGGQDDVEVTVTAHRVAARSIRPLHRWRPRALPMPESGDRLCSVGEAGKALVQAAIAADGKDNASAVVVEMRS